MHEWSCLGHPLFPKLCQPQCCLEHELSPRLTAECTWNFNKQRGGPATHHRNTAASKSGPLLNSEVSLEHTRVSAKTTRGNRTVILSVKISCVHCRCRRCVMNQSSAKLETVALRQRRSPALLSCKHTKQFTLQGTYKLRLQAEIDVKHHVETRSLFIFIIFLLSN